MINSIYRKNRVAWVCFALIIVVFCAIATRAADVSARSAILIEADTGEVIFEKNSHERLPMASTTKIMTALVALENGDCDKKISVSPKACGIEGSSIYLTAGEKLTLEDLLYALMLESANDAAAAIAYEISGGIDEFAALMNKKAVELGLSDTHFTNPHGLDNEAHYTTAADLAKLTAHAMKNDRFRKIVSTYKYQIPMNGDGVRVLLNHNKLLKLSQDVIGVKTGFTKRSGRCLVSAAERDGVAVIAVTLNAPDDWNDHLAMLGLGFAEYHNITLAESGQFKLEIPCVGAENGYIIAENRENCSVCVKESDVITQTVECDRLLFPPVFEGDVVGSVVFFKNGVEIERISLFSTESVEAVDPPTLRERLFGIFN